MLSGKTSFRQLFRFYVKEAFRPKGPLKNEQIHVPEVILVDERNTKSGPLSPREILSSMNRRLYDLVLVNPGHMPPIVKLIPRSYEFKRQQLKDEATTILRLQQREKEVKFGTSMATHDLEIRYGKLTELLEKAYRVRLVVEMKGAHRDPAKREHMNKMLMDRLRVDFGKDLAIMSPPESVASNLVTMIYSTSAKPALARKTGNRDEPAIVDDGDVENKRE